MRHVLWGLVGPLLLIGLLPSAGWSLSIGQRDTFEDGTAQNWIAVLGGASPVNVPSGGPAGAGDHYLLLTSVGGVGPGNRLTIINMSQWTGDFIAAGVSGIRMDLNNLGQTDLSLRLLFADPMGGPPTNQAFSAKAFKLPGDSGWTTAYFPIDPADLLASPGLGTVPAALHHTTGLLLFSSTGPAFPGDAIVATLGVDNITATPEPASAALLGSGLLALYTFTRIRRTTDGRQ